MRNWGASDALHIFVLTSFALAQPLFDRLCSRPSFLPDQGVEARSIVLLVLLLSVLLPALIVLLEVVAGALGRQVRPRLHAAMVFVLLAAIALPVVKRIHVLAGMVVVGLSLVVAGLGVWAYLRFARMRMIVTAAAPGILLFPALFLFHSSVSGLLFPRKELPPDPVRVRNPAPVVLLVFDEFCGVSLMNEDYEIDSVRYPNFAELARSATWFRNATSVHPRSEYAVPAILTGKYPPRNRRPIVSEYPQNLFTLLESTRSYEPAVFEPLTRLFPAEWDQETQEPAGVSEQIGSVLPTLSLVYLNHLFPSDLPFVLPDIPRSWFGLRANFDVRRDKRQGVLRYGWASDREQQFNHFLECLTPSQKPGLYFEHIALPHFSWCYLPSGKKYMTDDGVDLKPHGAYGNNSELWSHDELAVVHGYQRYLLQLGFTDLMIGKLIARLQGVGLYDPSLIIVTADHGLSFRPNMPRRLATEASLADIMSIPLFVKAPNQHEGIVSDRNVESIDVLPTIADILGLDLDWQTDGRSVLDASQAERAVKVFDNEGKRMVTDAQFESKGSPLEQMLAWFGSGAKPTGLFEVGPHPELLGRHTRELEVIGEANFEIELIRCGSSLSDDPRAVVPCYMEGRVQLHTDTELPVTLAVAVNGTIRAVTRTYLVDDIKNFWTAMVPESAYQPGENRVEFFVVSSAGGELTLQTARTWRRAR